MRTRIILQALLCFLSGIICGIDLVKSDWLGMGAYTLIAALGMYNIYNFITKQPSC